MFLMVYFMVLYYLYSIFVCFHMCAMMMNEDQFYICLVLIHSKIYFIVNNIMNSLT